MPDKKRDDQRPDEGQDATKGKSILVEETSFVDEERRTGKQLTGGGRKVADLEHVGAMSPDADPERDSESPREKP